MKLLILGFMTTTLSMATIEPRVYSLPDLELANDGNFLRSNNAYVAETTPNPIARLLGETYLKVEGILSHFFTYYKNNVSDFRRWFDSIYYEMDESVQRKILNELNLNLKSMDDLSNFWIETHGSLLKENLRELRDLIKAFEGGVNATNPTFNEAAADSLKSRMIYEKKTKDFLNQIKMIYGFLDLGLNNYMSHKFTDVHKMFLDASIAKKKLDRSFEGLSMI